MSKRNAITIGALILVLVTIGAYAMTQDEQTSHGNIDMGMQHDMTSMLEPLKPLRGQEFDRAFYSMMIPHHQGAVEMSEKILRTTKDLKVREWAQAIIADQNVEIEQMTNALDKIGGMDMHYAAMMDSDMAMMVTDTKDDTSYVRLMIPHHQSAVDMAELAEGRSNDPGLLNLTKNIVRTQNEEIAEFQHYLMKK